LCRRAEPSTLERINEDHPFDILIKPIDPAELGRAMARKSGQLAGILAEHHADEPA
jgi:hypothetical protein